ncbi:MAG TPA: tetratricopeptide repeat protein, partial [Tenuifilaceae bacterium]|nr:tetratricopeptide repeat protein [Tenuifilaceae bacterium]
MKGSLAAILLAGSLSLVTPRLWGQPLSLDSLLHELSTVKSSEGKYKILSSIAISYSDSSYSKSLEYWLEALEVAKKLESSKYTADILHQIGFTYLKMGEPKSALANFQNAAELYVSLNDNADLAGVYNDMGLIYRSWGRYDSALEFYLKSYKLYERLANAEGMAMASNSIGQIYYYRENYTKAVDYF